MASVLTLDVSGAFDQMLKEWLTWILHQRGLPQAVYNWTFFFMSDRWTTLAFDRQESSAFQVTTDIPQGSPVFLILFLFYNMELLGRCANPHDGVGCLGFVDDVTLIAWGNPLRITAGGLLRPMLNVIGGLGVMARGSRLRNMSSCTSPAGRPSITRLPQSK